MHELDRRLEVVLNPMAASLVALMGTISLNGISMSAIFTSVVTAAKVPVWLLHFWKLPSQSV